MRILILGSTGILGQTLNFFLLNNKKNKIFYISRKKSLTNKTHLYLEDFKNFTKLKKLILTINPTHIVNCLGVTKYNDTYKLNEETKIINTKLPKFLSILCLKNKIYMIHISTDCVFSGKKGNYSELSKKDAKDKVNANEKDKIINKYGSKMAFLINKINKILNEDKENKIILFSQWDSMLKLVSYVLKEYKIEYLECIGNIFRINNNINKFKYDDNNRLILLSSENCTSGNNLTEASHIILLDTMNNNLEHSRAIEDQAIGRAVRLGQKKNVNVIRLITKNTVEHEYYERNLENIE